MPTYRVGIWIAHPDVVVRAKNEDEAVELVNAFIEDKGHDWVELITSMDTDIDDIETSPDEEIGIDANDPFNYHCISEDIGDETEYICPHCGSYVHKNNFYDPKAEEGIESYPYVCPECDENFYGIEVSKE